MAQHIAWSSIELLHNVVRTLNYLSGLGQPLPVVRYRAKVTGGHARRRAGRAGEAAFDLGGRDRVRARRQLHGTNVGVQITDEGLVCQSRTGLLTPQSDLKGFATWVHGSARRFFESLPVDLVVFGEWAGPGVEKGMAISALPTKVFAVFAVQQGRGETARVIFDPAEITAVLGTTWNVEGLHVLPWEGSEVTLDFADTADLTTKAAMVSTLVEQIEKEDPWVKATFNVSGLGEGLVFYPLGTPSDPENLARLMWKAKGEKHRTAGTKQAAQIAPEVAGSTEAFVALMVTEARLEQGITACGGERGMRGIGNFLRWVGEDTRKESVAELEAAGLTWEQVQKAVQERSRDWFKAQAAR